MLVVIVLVASPALAAPRRAFQPRKQPCYAGELPPGVPPRYQPFRTEEVSRELFARSIDPTNFLFVYAVAPPANVQTALQFAGAIMAVLFNITVPVRVNTAWIDLGNPNLLGPPVTACGSPPLPI